MKKTLLVLSTTVGGGHRRAAEALVETAKSLQLPFEVCHEDVLTYTFPLFRKFYSGSYIWVANASPELWGYIYRRSGAKQSTSENKSPLVRLFDRISFRDYTQMLRNRNPVAVLCTHFLPYGAIADQLASPDWHIPFFAIPTDFGVHSLWINPSIKKYYAASEEAAWVIGSYGIPQSNIQVTGIPVHPQFGQKEKREDAAAKFGISPSKFTVMILSGGYGMGVVDKLVPAVAELLGSIPEQQFQFIIVCGKNPKLYNAISKLKYPDNTQPIIYQFVPFIDTLMDCSDVLVTKSGGLTVSEALAKQLPMIIYNAIPGQEMYNADYLLEHGAALSAGNIASLQFKLKGLIEHPQIISNIQSASRSIATPDAAKMILTDIANRLNL